MNHKKEPIHIEWGSFYLHKKVEKSFLTSIFTHYASLVSNPDTLMYKFLRI